MATRNRRSSKIAASFRLGRYPVTNRQFRDFFDDKGYETRQWWSEAGWAWLQKEGVTEPAWWRDPGGMARTSRWWG